MLGDYIIPFYVFATIYLNFLSNLFLFFVVLSISLFSATILLFSETFLPNVLNA